MNTDSLYNRIHRVIQEKISPLLKEHGGDITLKSVDEGFVKVRFEGHCSSCPSINTTLEGVVSKILYAEFGDEIKDVSVSREVNPELIEFAKNFFKQKNANKK